MNIDSKILEKALVGGNYVESQDWAKAIEKAKKSKTNVADVLVEDGLMSKDVLGQAMAEHHKVAYADLNSKVPSSGQILKIPPEVGIKLRAVLFSESDTAVVVSTDQPQNKAITSEVKKIFPKRKIEIRYSLSNDIENVFKFYKKPLETRFSKIIESDERIAPELIDEIFRDAVSFKASDIHIEPQEDDVVVRFRVDGILQEAGRIPKKHYDNILNRIKVQANLRIDEHNRTQDGSLSVLFGENRVDMRISIVPVLNGEKVAIRLLAQYVEGYSLDDIGLNEENKKILEEASKKPFGMILMTGPTGSGKTTTLYSVLRTINNPGVNITTIEDPVEFRIAGINQIPVNEATGLTFAKGLRSIVRQDPDIILVGEIRDQETAEIAINASLTGHLLLSTFHSNDAATGIPRLLDMGIEPFLLASTLEVVAGQRLVRKICEQCKQSQTLTSKEMESLLPGSTKFIKESKITVYKGNSCEACNGTGYSGRIGIYEFIQISPEMEELILENPSTKEIWKLARKGGAKSMFEDGLDKIKKGITSIDEVKRVAKVPDG